MDQGLIGFVLATIGGVLMLVGVLVLANAEKERTDITGEVAEAAGPGLYLIYAGLAAIGAGIVMMLLA
ncbi:MAG: hypothetical protein GQ558_08555 [Thermoplasmata archaeon]|nr:hypothetical protein [Thermoplasmata archaeon]